MKALVLPGGTKHDTDKVPLDLLVWLPPGPAVAICRVFEWAALTKYEPLNWRRGFKWRRLVGATLRHVFAFAAGEDKDPETGESHLAHAGCCILMLLGHMQDKLGEDDREKRLAPMHATTPAPAEKASAP